MEDGSQRSVIRYRRLGGGYRRADVEFALAELRETLRKLDDDLKALRERNEELEIELAAARAEAEVFRAKEREISQKKAAAARSAAEMEETASARARELVAQAEEAAMRIGSEASRRVEDANAELDELQRLKTGLLDTMRTAVGGLAEAIGRVERGEDLFPGAPGDGAGETGAEDAAGPGAAPPDTVSIPAAPLLPVPGTVESESVPEASLPGVPSMLPPAPAVQPLPERAEEEEFATVFDARVELDAGPFPDFAALSAFERELERLPGIEDVYVRRFGAERAVIEMTLGEPGPLLHTMQEHLSYGLEVRSARPSMIVFDVSAQAPAGPL